MTRLALTVRMLVGLSMVAGGVVLVTPLASRLVAAATASRASSIMAAPVAAGAVEAGSPVTPSIDVPAPPVVASAANQDPADVLPHGAFADGLLVPGPNLPPEPPSLRQAYRPPPPPHPLGSTPQEFSLPQPGMPELYRAAQGVPPPPLLDGARPEGAHGMGDHARGAHAIDSGRPLGPSGMGQPSAIDVPRSTYRVRDGDDLAGIAARFYGHPAAAAAVWEVNRDRLVDPGLLPIGLELRLPAPWEIDVHPTTSATAIEPRRAGAALPNWSESSRPAMTATPRAATPWLGISGPSATPASWPGGQAAALSGGRIIVAPGETLVSLATRLYGDPTAARRIWEANRDRLRSPELLVPGMELRLP
jgi:nucleoid-associated protein YgaU